MIGFDPPSMTLLEREALAAASCWTPASDPPHLVAGRALIAIRGLFRAQGQLARYEGDHLELLQRKRWYGRLGYSSFRDFVREALQLSPTTARRRIALSQIAGERSEFAAALDSGALSPCQVLALRPMRDAPDLGDWIDVARDCTVRELEQLLSEYLARDRVAIEATSLAEDEPGRRIAFAAPASAAVAWAQAMDMAQRVLGWDAPHYRCVEAVLAETADVWGDWCEPSPSTETQNADVVDHIAPNENGAVPPASNEDNSAPGPAPPLLKISRDQLETLQRTIKDAEREIKAIALVPAPSEDDPDASLLVLAELKRKDRQLRLLFARLLRDADTSNVLAFLGYLNITQFLVSRLKVSARTAARYMSEAWAFEDNPDLARAFSSGRIGLGQAYLVNRVASMSSQTAFIRRAETITHLQFEREVQFLERFAECVPSIARQLHGPFPLPNLSSVLIECLRGLGWSDTRLEGCVGAFEKDDVAGDVDPVRNHLLMGRLEGLLDLVAIALEEHDAEVAGRLPTLGPSSEATATLLPTLGPLSVRTTISFWAPESLIEQWNAAVARIQELHGPFPTWAAALFLARHAVKEWERVDPSRRPEHWNILERDEWRCQAPGCTTRRQLEAHHIIFRSQNGSDDPENLITLCHGHHRHGIHDGYLHVEGAAPGGLRWRLGGGQLPGGLPRPTRTYQGSRLEPAT